MVSGDDVIEVFYIGIDVDIINMTYYKKYKVWELFNGQYMVIDDLYNFRSLPYYVFEDRIEFRTRIINELIR